MASQQLFPFEPRNTALTAFHAALENLDLARAIKGLVSLKAVWPDCRLDHEEELLTKLPGLLSEPMSLDLALDRWEELVRHPLAEGLAPGLLQRLERRFHEILLERSEFPLSQSRTPGGRSIGWLHLKAGQWEEAKKRLVCEIERFPEDPLPRLHLAHCLESDDQRARTTLETAALSQT